jgi:hypothetical protein
MAPPKEAAPVRSNIPKPSSNSGSPTQAVRHFYQEDLARRWGISPRTLERWRLQRVGPPYLKLRGRILYRMEDVQEFEANNLRTPSGSGEQQ